MFFRAAAAFENTLKYRPHAMLEQAVSPWFPTLYLKPKLPPQTKVIDLYWTKLT